MSDARSIIADFGANIQLEKNGKFRVRDHDRMAETLTKAQAYMDQPTVSPTECPECGMSKGLHAKQCHGEAVSPTPPSGASADGWIACSERMPTGLQGNCLAWHPEWCRPRLLGWYDAPTNPMHWRDEEDNRFHGDVTHWCPLPPPPAALAAQASQDATRKGR